MNVVQRLNGCIIEREFRKKTLYRQMSLGLKWNLEIDKINLL